MNFKLDKVVVNTIKGNVITVEGLCIEDAPDNFLDQFAHLMEVDKAPSEARPIEALERVMRNFQRANVTAKDQIAQQKAVVEQLLKYANNMFPKTTKRVMSEEESKEPAGVMPAEVVANLIEQIDAAKERKKRTN